MIAAKKNTLQLVSDAQKIWSVLNGVVCIYKPKGISVNRTRMTLMSNICRDFNELKVREPKKRVVIEPTSDFSNYLVKTETDLADHVLVVGDRYQPQDIIMQNASYLGKFTSGVMVMGINRGTKTAKLIRETRPVRVYHITGVFGRSTETHFSDSPTTGRATFDHIYLDKLSSCLSSMQTSHQKKMFELCGVDLQSQAAYELAAQGPLRPIKSNIPLIYSMSCIEYKKPFFTLEIHACNESEAYLGILINEIAISLKSLAHCQQIRCIRESYFTLEDALVKRHWNIETIIANMKRCKEIVAAHPDVLHQFHPTITEMEKNK